MRGGYREGSGRKQGFAAKKAEEAREILAGMVISEIVPTGEALIAKAKKRRFGHKRTTGPSVR